MCSEELERFTAVIPVAAPTGTNSQVLTLALLMVGDHHRVNLLFGIWFKPDLWAFVSFFHFIDSSKPLAFSLGRADNQSHKMWNMTVTRNKGQVIEAGNTHRRNGEDCFM